MSDLYAVADFERFWPHYVRLHTRRETQLLHALAREFHHDSPSGYHGEDPPVHLQGARAKTARL